MDERLDNDFPTVGGRSERKRRRWRSRLSFALLALIIVVGYAIMFFVIDHWQGG